MHMQREQTTFDTSGGKKVFLKVFIKTLTPNWEEL